MTTKNFPIGNLDTAAKMYIITHMQKVTITIIPGAGGEDAKDWAKMLYQMYVRYAKKKNWMVRPISENTLEIKGEKSYELLKHESGVHRLVRISPFDVKKIRHTSFALVEVLPELSLTEIEKISIPEKDLKIEFYRSSGPGGQNVNRRETAVRITHLPTGLSASSQMERSQLQNREKALELLKTKLYQLMKQKQEEKIENLKVKVSPEWGHRIRSYVLYPYKMVKDHRTGVKTTKVEEVLEGDLDEFIRPFIKQN